MLDAIAQTLAEQAAQPAAPATVDTPKAALVAPQQAVVPVLKPTVSAPESLSPSFLRQSTRDSSSASSTAAKPSTAIPSHTDAVKETPAANRPNENPSSPTKPDQAVNVAATSKAPEQAVAMQRQLLHQRLADIVVKDKLLREAKLRAHLEAMVLASAQAGQFLQARRMAQDQMLSTEGKAALLAQIEAIAAARSPTKPELAPKRSLSKSLRIKLKPWTPGTVSVQLPSVLKPVTPPSGRSLPSVLPYTPPQGSTSYSYVPQSPPQYVSYSFNGFGRTIGGFGVVVDGNTPEFNGQSWAAYATGNRSNAELWSGLSFIFPLAVPAPITSGFGWRVHPIRGDRRFHSGTDLGAPMGTPVLAAADGKVALSDWLNGYGLAIILSHQNDTRETLYGHLSQVFVKPGQWVEKGTVIGRVGSTGLSTCPHLHFELRQRTASGWQAIDPGAQLKYALARLVKAMQSG